MAAQGARPLAHHGGADLGQGRAPADRLPGDQLLRRAQVRRRSAQEPGRGRSRAAAHLREARHPDARAGGARRRRGRLRVRQRLGRDHVQGEARRARRHLLLDLGGAARSSGAGAALSGLGRAAGRQLLRGAQFRGVHRRLLRLRAQGRALPDGAVHLLPDQRRRDRAVRAHPDHRRRGRLRQLPGRLHRAAARREPAARRGGRADRAGRRPDQVLDRAELVSRRPRGPGRHLQLRDQARRLPRPPLQDLVDPGGDRLGDHLEVPELHPAGRRIRSASSTRSR